MNATPLQAPFPYFGGKRRAAETIWAALGDVGGYVEPFVGDGMAIALETAVAVVPLVLASQRGWSTHLARVWQRSVHRITARRRFACQALAGLCRHPLTADIALAVASRAPASLAWLVAWMNQLSRELKDLQPWECTLPA